MPKGTSLQDYINEQILDPENAAYYIIAAMEENDPDYLNQVLGKVAKVHGISELAEETGIARQAIYNMISKNGNPTLQNINKILDALGLELTVRVKKTS